MFLAHLLDANPRIVVVPDDDPSAAAPLGCDVHPGHQPLVTGDERELGRYFFFGSLICGTESSTGLPFRSAMADQSHGSAQFQLTRAVEGGGIVVVTDRRLLGSMKGYGPIPGVDPKGTASAFFAMDYTEIDEITLHRKSGFLGGVKEPSLTIVCLNPLGSITMQIDGERVVRGQMVNESRLKTARPMFESAARAAATWRLSNGEETPPPGRLEALRDGQYETDEDGNPTAVFVAD